MTACTVTLLPPAPASTDARQVPGDCPFETYALLEAMPHVPLCAVHALLPVLVDPREDVESARVKLSDTFTPPPVSVEADADDDADWYCTATTSEVDRPALNVMT